MQISYPEAGKNQVLIVLGIDRKGRGRTKSYLGRGCSHRIDELIERLTTAQAFKSRFRRLLPRSCKQSTRFMAGRKIKINRIREIYRLRSTGEPILQIAKRLGISRNTVKKYLLQAEDLLRSKANLLEITNTDLESLLISSQQELTRSNHLKDLLPILNQELEKPGVTRLKLWKEYKSQVQEAYSYTQFCEYLKNWKKSAVSFENRN